MEKHKETIEATMLTIGTTYSLSNIEDILGVIILLIQLIWIISKIIYLIYKSKKTKHKITSTEVKQQVIEAVEDLTEWGDSDG